MHNSIHTEQTFEEATVAMLTGQGWTERPGGGFDAENALDVETLLAFLRDSQPAAWAKYETFYNADARKQLVFRLIKELELRGTLDVLRRGIVDSGIELKLAFFKPDHGLNPDAAERFAKNRLVVMRQVHYSVKEPNKSVDLLFLVNGLPVATVELKNPLTGQTYKNAIHQYKTTRDPKELLFAYKKRTLVHFAVDPENIFLCTKLDGDRSFFLPFNRGNHGGAGNPPNPEGYRTDYFWLETLRPESWMEILGRFLHIQQKETKINERIVKQQRTLFPRYHQIDVVRSLCRDAGKTGPGQRYLIQHSAGSGKSNSIAWLAYRLSSLYNSKDKRVFDSIVVVTDRTVLDQQLQDTIYQFDHKQGVVQRIDKDSAQLASAIASGTNIIITTLQKFKFALKHLSEKKRRNYAVIIDEAHSSQGGDSSRNMSEALGGKNLSLEESERIESEFEAAQEDPDDQVRKVIDLLGPHKNISFFAFTATPKPKTLEVFGTRNEAGQVVPFHLYSMRQAIEEGFILDVLKNYTTYETYYRFCKQIADDPELNKKKAQQAIGCFASLHPTNVAQKTQVIIEHFRQVTQKQIGGKAKAMVVTGSRKHALRYYLAFKSYIQEQGYTDFIKPLVAFSGSVIDDDYPDGVTEPQLNKFGEKELPERFSEEYQILLVADKYQTGFDQPLLQTMYVDKKLSGVKAVQTLSRLNRTCPGKEETFILDFANERQVIVDSFQPYYEMTTLDETTDPNHLYDLKNKMDGAQVYWTSEVDGFAKVFYKNGRLGNRDQARLNAFLDPAVDRYSTLDEDGQDEFKSATISFVRLYSFLSQIMPFQDVSLEKLYSYSRLLLAKLPKCDYAKRLQLDNEVALQYYRLQKIGEEDLVLEIRGENSLQPVTEAGISREKETREKLSSIITLLNDKFGTEFTESDRLLFDQVENDLFQDDTLRQQAINNSPDTFQYAVEDIFPQAFVDRMGVNQDTFDRVVNNRDLVSAVVKYLAQNLYDRFNAPDPDSQ